MLQAGFASRTLTTPSGISLDGYFNRRPNTGALDALKARAAVFKDAGGSIAGIVSLDLLYSYKELVERVEALLRKSGSPLQGRLIICATHTHTGPDLRDKAEPALAEFCREAFAQEIAGCVEDAVANLGPALVKGASGEDNPLAFIRRYWMRNGGVTTNPGKLNPDIVKPESELDRTIQALSFQRPGEDAPCCVIANICNHTDTTGGTLVSADWPGAFERKFQKLSNADTMVMTLIGASGDVNHFDVSSAEGQTSSAEAGRIGAGYAQIVHKLLKGAKPVEAGSVRILSSEVEAFKRDIPQEDIKKAEYLLAKDAGAAEGDFTSEDLAKGEGPIMRVFASELLAFAESEAGMKVSLPVRGLRLGNAVSIVSLPGEPFNAIGTAIREASPAEFTLVASNALDAFGYIPLKECFSRGGYETLPVSHGGMAPDTAERLIAATTELLKK